MPITNTKSNQVQILSMLKLNIRPVKPTERDLTTLQAIATESFMATFSPYNTLQSVVDYTSNNYNLSKLQAEVEAPTSRTFFLEGNGQPIGYLKLNWGPTQTESNFPAAMEIQRIYLLPRYWGEHLGNYLMEYALEYAKEHGFKQAWLGVWQKNQRAQGFYHRYGFKQAGTHEFYMGDHYQCDDLLLKEIQ